MRVLTYFYVPLYLTAICSMLVCLRSTGTPFFRESTSGHAVFIASWFDSGYIQSGTLLSCGGDSFSPDVAYSSSLDSVMPMKGKHTINYLQYHEYGSGIPSLEREVQWDFRVHSSSCGALCGVVHSPFEWFYHRCHCNYRDLVLFVGRLPCCGSVCVVMSCGGGFFSPGGAYDSVWDSVKPIAGYTSSIISSTNRSLGVYAC